MSSGTKTRQGVLNNDREVKDRGQAENLEDKIKSNIVLNTWIVEDLATMSRVKILCAFIVNSVPGYEYNLNLN